MAAPTNTRPAVITPDLVETLSEFLAFRHLFRRASIALMRWDKLAALSAKADQTYSQTRSFDLRANPHRKRFRPHSGQCSS